MNEWNNIMDADKSIKTTAERRKRGWPNKKKREEFQKRFNEYWVGGHSDMGNYELNKKMLKRRTKKVKENTFITIRIVIKVFSFTFFVRLLSIFLFNS